MNTRREIWAKKKHQLWEAITFRKVNIFRWDFFWGFSEMLSSLDTWFRPLKCHNKILKISQNFENLKIYQIMHKSWILIICFKERAHFLPWGLQSYQKVLFQVEMNVLDHGDLLFCRSNYIRNVFEWSHSEKCGLKDDLLSPNGTIWYGFAINVSFWDFLKLSPQLEGHASKSNTIKNTRNRQFSMSTCDFKKS